MAHDTTIDGYYVGSNGGWIKGMDKQDENKICGKWYGLYFDDTTIGVIDNVTICGRQYKVIKDNGSSIVIEIYNNDGTTSRMKFCNFSDNQMSSYWYNPNTKSYTGCNILTRAD